MSSQPQQQQQGGGPGGPGMGASLSQCCSDCVRSIPLMTRVLMLMALLSSVVGVWFVGYFVMCAHNIVTSYGIQSYRILLSPLFAGSFTSILVMLFVWMSVPRLELYKGSTSVLVWVIGLSVGTNLILFTMGAVLEFVAHLNADLVGGLFCDTGMWSLVMGLMAIDAALDPVQSRYVCM